MYQSHRTSRQLTYILPLKKKSVPGLREAVVMRILKRNRSNLSFIGKGDIFTRNGEVTVLGKETEL